MTAQIPETAEMAALGAAIEAEKARQDLRQKAIYTRLAGEEAIREAKELEEQGCIVAATTARSMALDARRQLYRYLEELENQGERAKVLQVIRGEFI